MTNRNIIHKPIQPEIEEIVLQHGRDREAALEILKDLDWRGQLTADTVTDTARSLQVPYHHIYGLATFYSMLSFEPRQNVLRVCDGPVCWLKRASDQGSAISGQFSFEGEWTVERTSCLGLCDRAPAGLVNDDQAGPITPTDADKICQGWRGVPRDYSQPRPGEVRAMLANIGKIDPNSLDSAIKFSAYEGLKKALKMKSDEVIAAVEASGLQGRGGAGFPVGRKWKFVADENRTPKYMICNADESEPLIFKDRVLIDTNPHQILEGMAIGGYACGASEGYVYIRGEYESQAQRLEDAIRQAETRGLLGENILGSEFSFKIHVHRGAGAYICGEETALIESLEGKRGEPRLRPPYPPQSGFRGQPTAVNNVESFAAVPGIVRNGTQWWRGLSLYPTPGTKLYMVLGHINTPGLFEAPFGLTLREAIDKFGSGMRDGSKFKFALTGGAAGTIVSEQMLDTPIDYASSQKGISLGAGAFLVCDQSVSVTAFLRELLHFFAVESCGKCTPCRVGTWRAHELLTRMAAGNIQSGDAAELATLAENMFLASFCGLGQSVSIPINTALRNFGEEFEDDSV